MKNQIDVAQDFIDVLKSAKNVVVMTGAGASAESGIETFRDPEGHWTKFNPMELASEQGFIANPKLVWAWYQYRRDKIAKAKPNQGHYAITKMQSIFPNFTLVTQNVDGFHQQAGAINVLELHGSIHRNIGLNTKKYYDAHFNFDGENLPFSPDGTELLRPGVVWFGEQLPKIQLSQSEMASANCDLFFSIGTSAEVFPAANLPSLAKRNGAIVVEVNPNHTAISEIADYKFSYPSGEVLPKFVELLQS